MVEEGLKLRLERQDDPKPEVLFYKDDKSVLIGTPTLANVSVELTKINDYKEKTNIFRFKSKSRHRRRKGHKQPMSVLKVVSIKKGSSK